MYPKITPKSAQQEEIRKRELQQAKWDALKNLMQEQYTKKFSNKKQDNIKREIDATLQQHGQKLTSQALKELDNRIKDTSNYEMSQLSKKSEDQVSVRSKMSGASNLEKLCNKSQAGSIQSKRNTTSANQQVFNTNNEKLDFLTEENEWAAIIKYNEYLAKKKDSLLLQKEKQKRELYKKELFEQMEEYKQKQRNQKQEEKEYFSVLQKQLDVDEQEEQAKIARFQQKIEEEKRQRDLQMRDNHRRRKIENRNQKFEDQQTINQIKKEIEEEKEFQLFKKENFMKIQKKIQADVLQQQKDKMEQNERDRLEDIRLQEAYVRLVDQQEEDKAEDNRRRAAQASAFARQDANSATYAFEQKMNIFEERAQKYNNRVEKKKLEEEQAKKAKIQQNKLTMKSNLNEQQLQKKLREQTEKEWIREQADMWKQDTDQYEQYNLKKAQIQKQQLELYKDELNTQISSNIQKKKAQNQQMSEQEMLLNQKLREEMSLVNQIC